MPKLRVVWLALLIAAMITPSLVSAQTEEVPDLVTQALDNLHDLQSYHFIAESTVTSEISSRDDTTTTATVFSSEGSALQNGDNQTTITVNASNGEQAMNPPLEIERIVADGTLYVNFHLEDTPFGDMFNVEEGWWRYDDLRATFEGGAIAVVVDNFVKLSLPAQNPALRAEFFTSVIESDPQTLEGRPVRVFEVELDALNLLFAQSTFTTTGLDRLVEMVRSAGLAQAGELQASLRLWIGADDAQIYRVEGDSKTYLPYLTTGNNDIFPYDLRTTSSFNFTLSKHGEPVEISAPSPINEP